tara:strand:- start:41 stop:214 length:174 start_codon:yes stop_codon:yes gene_type:complete
MLKVTASNVHAARVHAWKVTELIEAIPENVFNESEVEAAEVMAACDKLRMLLNVLEA